MRRADPPPPPSLAGAAELEEGVGLGDGGVAGHVHELGDEVGQRVEPPRVKGQEQEGGEGEGRGGQEQRAEGPGPLGGPASEEAGGHARAAVAQAEPEGRHSGLVRGPDVSPARGQEAHHGHVALEARHVDRPLPVHISLVHRAAGVGEDPAHVGVAAHGCEVERRLGAGGRGYAGEAGEAGDTGETREAGAVRRKDE